MSIEAGVLIDRDGNPIHWHLPMDRNVGALPDSRDLWSVIWDNRVSVWGFAHSHPGSGSPGPSWEDVTTFSAIESALGRRLTWWITSSDQVIEIRWLGPDKHRYQGHMIEDPSWVGRLRQESHYNK